jgi:hypothetical protein
MENIFWPFIWWIGLGLYALGACVVFFYISIPALALVNYLYFLFLKRKNKFSIGKQILFNLYLLLLSPLGQIIGKLLYNLFHGIWGFK